MPPTRKSDQQSPYFKMFPRDFFASSRVARMNSDEQGTYALLLFREWLDGYIPSDIEEIADMLGLSLEVFEKRWKRISRCFAPVDDQPEKLQNIRLEAERSEMIERSETNKAAAETRWQKKRKNSEHESYANALQPHNERNAIAIHSVSHADADADADITSSVDKSTSDELDAIAPALPGIDTQSKTAKTPEEWHAPPIPDDLALNWPEPGRPLKRLAIRFLVAFGNCTAEKSQAKHGPAYVDALAAMSTRSGVTPHDAWRAFGYARDAHNGKPLFGSQARTALNHLRPAPRNVTPIGAHPSFRQHLAAPLPNASKPPLVTPEYLAAML